jgi:hypothetical protein
LKDTLIQLKTWDEETPETLPHYFHSTLTFLSTHVTVLAASFNINELSISPSEHIQGHHVFPKINMHYVAIQYVLTETVQ